MRGVSRWRFEAAAALAVLWTLFVADKFVVELSPHGSQKQVIASYYRLRKDERWVGSSTGAAKFYTRTRSIASGHRQRVLDATQSQKYLAAHKGERLFFLLDGTDTVAAASRAGRADRRREQQQAVSGANGEVSGTNRGAPPSLWRGGCPFKRSAAN